MIKIKKDLVFCVVCVCWLASNIISSILFKDFGIVCSNVTFIVLMGIIIVFKKTNKPFNDWLESPFNK